LIQEASTVVPVAYDTGAGGQTKSDVLVAAPAAVEKTKAKIAKRRTIMIDS
jgi:hypothetical protein